MRFALVWCAVGLTVWRASQANEVASTERVREQEVGCEQGARLRNERTRERAMRKAAGNVRLELCGAAAPNKGWRDFLSH